MVYAKPYFFGLQRRLRSCMRGPVSPEAGTDKGEVFVRILLFQRT